MSLDFFAGCVGGAAGVIVGHPLDTVKVRLQIQTSDNIKYKGTFDCLRTIVKQENVRGLYKGMSSPLVGVAGVNALIFGVYGSLRPYVHGSPGNDSLWAHFLAGSVAGGVQSFIASPMELVKTRMQLNEFNTTSSLPEQKAPSPKEVLKSLYQKEGGLFRGVFKGWGVTIFREIPGFGTYFATYEALTTRSGREVGTFGMMMAGGLAGVMSWIVTFPIDVVKTRLQSDLVGRYSGAVDCLKKTYQTEGYSAFSRGLVSTVIRAFPTNAATFTVVTWIMRWAETHSIDSIQDGEEYLKEVLRESNKLKERIEETLKLPLPHYLTYLNAGSLGSNCAKIVSKYGLTTQATFNFDELVSISKTTSDDHSNRGLIRERFDEAFKVERAQNQVRKEALVRNMTSELHNDDSIESNNSSTNQNLPFRVMANSEIVGEEIQQTTPTETTSENNEAVDPPTTTMHGRPSTMYIIKSLLLGNLKLRSFFLTFASFLPTVRLCNCWDDNCVCFN